MKNWIPSFFLWLITVIFVCAKIFGIIDWGWIYVFMPILVPFTFVVIVLVAVGLHIYFKK